MYILHNFWLLSNLHLKGREDKPLVKKVIMDLVKMLCGLGFEQEVTLGRLGT
jgi:hypothetical protein